MESVLPVAKITQRRQFSSFIIVAANDRYATNQGRTWIRFSVARLHSCSQHSLQNSFPTLVRDAIKNVRDRRELFRASLALTRERDGAICKLINYRPAMIPITRFPPARIWQARSFDSRVKYAKRDENPRIIRAQAPIDAQEHNFSAKES